MGTPDYELVSAQGPPHARLFTMAINLKGERLAEAEAGSKKEAEQGAARAALGLLGKENGPRYDG